MEFIKTYRENSRPVVFLFSEPCIFSLYLLEKLLSNFSRTVIFSTDTKGWERLTTHVVKSSNLIIDSLKNYAKYPKPNYFLMVDFEDILNHEHSRRAISLSKAFKTKGLVVIPESQLNGVNSDFPETVGIIGVENLFGPRMELKEENRISQVIEAAISQRKIKIPEGEKIAPVFMGEAAKQIVSWLFSFGPYGETVSVSSNKIRLIDLVEIIRKFYPDFKYQITRGDVRDVTPNKYKTYLVGKIDKPFEETLSWFKQNTSPKTFPKKNRFGKKIILKTLIALSVILTTPFALTLISIFLLLVSGKMLISEDFRLARFFLNSTRVVSGVAKSSSGILSGAPLFGKLYKPTGSLSYITKNASLVGLKGLDLINETSLLSDRILGAEKYDVNEIQEKIIPNLKYVETTLSFIEAEVKNYPGLYKKVNLTQIKKLVTNAGIAAPSLSELLGADKTKTYLILFQNNMELRPTGGFIGSFALATLSAGNLNEISVQDVYSADGQLKGHVEPPKPIKKYLNQANWFLRDSNWDPNFPVSAERAEWFLDKEIGVSVDGVVAIDLNVIKDVLAAIGPIYLSDYQTSVTVDNFYEKTQSEVEGNFFPGSTKKANFITVLSKEMINALFRNEETSKVKIAKIVYNNLEARHIQIFLHDSLAKEALSNLGWDGAINYSSCGGNCYSDLLGIVEANLGVNKSNYYLERKYKISVEVETGLIKKNLLLTYQNKANPAIGNNGIYKTYVRLVVPQNSILESVTVGNSPLQSDVETVAGRKEIGFYFELSPGQTKAINIFWLIPQPLSLEQRGEYRMYVRKQAGTPAEPISVSYKTSSGVDLTVEPGYNTLFVNDIHSKITWKK